MKEQENPYLNARKKHNEYEGGLIASRHIWQMFGILGLLVGLAGVGGMVHIGSQSKLSLMSLKWTNWGRPTPFPLPTGPRRLIRV